MGQLTSRIGTRVTLETPNGRRVGVDKPRKGRIIDEVWAHPAINTSPPRPREGDSDCGDYSFCSQLIRLDDGTYTILLAYYHRPPGEDWWEFGQGIPVFQRLSRQGAGRTRRFLRQVIIDAVTT